MASYFMSFKLHYELYLALQYIKITIKAVFNRNDIRSLISVMYLYISEDWCH